MPHRSAFTLIELLVVITIIVVLLALLTPALDKAIYQAELAVCGANTKGIANGVSLYAVDQKRRYPYREDIMNNGWEPSSLNDGGDTRLLLLPYMSLEQLLDPLCEKVDISVEANESSGAHVYANYHLWFGWQYDTEDFGTESGMFKLGDRFAYGGTRFSVLATDYDVTNEDLGQVYSSHPDREGPRGHAPILEARAMQSEAFELVVETPFRQTLSRWQNESTWLRGALDMNFAFADGSVDRLDTVLRKDSRMFPVPWFRPGTESNGFGPYWTYLPPR